MTALLRCENLNKIYFDGIQEIKIVNNVSFSINKTEMIAITGASGSGKSTLLYLLSGLESSTSGQIFLKNQSLNELTSDKISKLRNQYLGFVYQFHHLLLDFSALENVMLPALILGVDKSKALELALELLKAVGLSHREKHLPSALSGGERQRVAIARALINKPDLIFLDEPTGNLDQKNTHLIFDLMLKLNADYQSAFLMVTHDLKLANLFDKQFQMQDGNLTLCR